MTAIGENAAEARKRLSEHGSAGHLDVSPAENGSPTATYRGVHLHSTYNPEKEAAQLVDGVLQSRAEPVIVLGCGLGYHLTEILARTEPDVAVVVVEPEPEIAHAALERLGEFDGAERCRFFVGRSTDEIAGDDDFRRAMLSGARMVEHPASARLFEAYFTDMKSKAKKILSRARRLRILVVSPMYGGSLPVARYTASALKRLGHKVDFLDFSPYHDAFKSVRELVKSPRNAAQLEGAFVSFLSEVVSTRAHETKPALVLALAQAPLQLKTLATLRRRGTPTVMWFVENYRHLTYWREFAPAYDFFFTIQRGAFFDILKEMGVKNYCYLPTGCDPTVHKRADLTANEQEVYGCDLSFAGAAYYNRRQTFEGLLDHDFKIWGIEWGLSQALKPFVQKDGEPYTTEEMVKIVNGSKISLNLHSSNRAQCVEPEGDFVNPRLFEIASCGGFQLVDDRDVLPELFEPGTEIVTFDDVADLRKQIDYYLSHESERSEIADRAMARAHRDHTYDMRMKTMLEFVLDRAGDRIGGTGAGEFWTVAEAADRAGTYPELAELLKKLPGETEFNVNAVWDAVEQREGEMTEPEALLRVLKDMVDTAKIE
jgi:spore maturation protein CgeB